MPASNVNMPSKESFDDEYDDEALEEIMAKKNATRSLANKIGTGVGLASLGINAAVIALMFVLSQLSYVTLVASGVAILVALLVVKRQMIDMAPTHTLRFIHNKLRRKVHHLYLANNQLKDNVDDLQQQILSLQDCENQLQSLTQTQGHNVNQLVALVKENAQILHQQTQAIKANATMTLVDLALDSDRDESSLFSETEITSLLARLQNVEGIEVKETILRQKLEQDNSLAGVLAMLNYAAKYAEQSALTDKKNNKKPAMTEEPVFIFSAVTNVQ